MVNRVVVPVRIPGLLWFRPDLPRAVFRSGRSSLRRLNRQLCRGSCPAGPARRTLNRDYTKEKPVSDSVFSFYKGLYSYDRIELDPRVESVDDSSQYWRTEKISFRAAYGNDRVMAYLFLPRNARPPYSTIIYFPGFYVFFEKSSENISPDLLDFAVRSGRAVLYPIYMGTYERRITSSDVRRTPEEVVQPGSACLPVGPKAGRDLVMQVGQRPRTLDRLPGNTERHRFASTGLLWSQLGGCLGASSDRSRAAFQGECTGRRWTSF
jgi:hypothetical protein